MAKITAFLVLPVLLLTRSPAAAQQDAHPVAPFKMFDNLYYVGIDWVSAYVLKTSGGLIMIDTLYDNFTEHAVKSIEQLGMTISAGLRRNRRSSRSTIASIRCITHLLIIIGLSRGDASCSASRN